MWLARILAIIDGDTNEGELNQDEESVPFVELLTPDMFSPKVINAIKADPTSLDLHAINSYFYALALKWISLFSDREFADIVTTLLLERSQAINNHASSVSVEFKSSLDSVRGTQVTAGASNAAASMFLLTLDEFEKKVYKKSHESYKETKKWMFEK